MLSAKARAELEAAVDKALAQLRPNELPDTRRATMLTRKMLLLVGRLQREATCGFDDEARQQLQAAGMTPAF